MKEKPALTEKEPPKEKRCTVVLSNRQPYHVETDVAELAHKPHTDLTLLMEAARIKDKKLEVYIREAALQQASSDLQRYYRHHYADGGTSGVRGSRDRDLEKSYLNHVQLGLEPTPSKLRRAVGTGLVTAKDWWENRMPAFVKANKTTIASLKKKQARKSAK
jgi:hypothetical protein